MYLVFADAIGWPNHTPRVGCGMPVPGESCLSPRTAMPQPPGAGMEAKQLFRRARPH